MAYVKTDDYELIIGKRLEKYFKENTKGYVYEINMSEEGFLTIYKYKVAD